MRALQSALISVTGAACQVAVNGIPVPQWQPLLVPGGSEVVVSPPQQGLRATIAIHGVIQCSTFLGSAAPDAWLGFDQHLAPGDLIDVATCVSTLPAETRFGLPVMLPSAAPPGLTAPTLRLDAVTAPDIAFVPEAYDLLAGSVYVVKPQVNTVGMRLHGPVVHPALGAEIVSHGVPVGAIEIPPSDELIVLGRSRSLTAGYPVVGVVTTASLSLASQAWPGANVTFRWRSLEEARLDVRRQQLAIANLRQRVQSLFAANCFPYCATGCAQAGARHAGHPSRGLS